MFSLTQAAKSIVPLTHRTPWHKGETAIDFTTAKFAQAIVLTAVDQVARPKWDQIEISADLCDGGGNLNLVFLDENGVWHNVDCDSHVSGSVYICSKDRGPIERHVPGMAFIIAIQNAWVARSGLPKGYPSGLQIKVTRYGGLEVEVTPNR